MPKLPYIPIYMEAWRSDPKLAGADTDVRCIWMEVIMAMWESDVPGVLVLPDGWLLERWPNVHRNQNARGGPVSARWALMVPPRVYGGPHDAE